MKFPSRPHELKICLMSSAKLSRLECGARCNESTVISSSVCYDQNKAITRPPHDVQFNALCAMDKKLYLCLLGVCASRLG